MRRPPRRAAGVGALLTALATLTIAAADVASAGWVFDRLTWSPGGDTLAVEAWPEAGGPGRPLVLLVDATTGRIEAPADARAFQISPDRRALLLLGSTGLWWYDLDDGSTRQVYFHPPGGGPRVTDFAFRADGPGAVFLTGAAGDSAGAFWVLDGPGAEPVRGATYLPGGPPPSGWKAMAAAADSTFRRFGRGPRHIRVAGASLRFDYDGQDLQIQAGSAAGRVLLENVAPEWAAWPPRPQPGDMALLALRSTGIDSIPGLLRIRPGPDLKPLMSGPAPQGIWIDNRTALMIDDQGALYRYEAGPDTLRSIDLDDRPGWSRDLAPSPMVATLRVERWPRSARQFEAQEALLSRIVRELPGPVRGPAASSGRRLGGSDRCVGVFGSLEEAAAVAPTFRSHGLDVEPTRISAREMSGTFDYGTISAAGATAWCRRTGRGPAEIWLQRPGEAPRRILTGDLSR